MAILNGTLQTPSEGSGGRQVVHVQTSTDQTVVNTALIQEAGAYNGYISNSNDLDGETTDDLTKVLANLTNTGSLNSNTVCSTNQPTHACIWFKRAISETTPVDIPIG